MLHSIAIAAFIAASAASAPSSSELSLDQGLPKLLFGRSHADLAKRFPKLGATYQVETEGDPFVMASLEIEGRHITLRFEGGRVEGFETDDERIQTLRGARVGLTLKELQALYPTGQFHHGWADGSYMAYVVEISAGSIAFQIAHADLTPDQLESDSLKLADPKVSSRKVISVWVRSKPK